MSELEKNYSSPRWSGEYPDCSMPMTMDTYSNCSFGCIYCFSQYQRGIGKGACSYFNKRVSSVNVEKIKSMFLNPDSTQFGEYIKKRKVFQWGGLSDQFDDFEREHGVTLELLRFFREIDYPISFSTKGVWWLDDERYTELFKGNKNWNCKFSIITENSENAKKIEVGVPSPLERLKAIEKFSNLEAGGATLRLRPFIIGVSSKDYLSLIKNSYCAGSRAVSTEFFCLETRNKNSIKKYKIISDMAGFDIVSFYRQYSLGAGYLRLNRKIKAPFVKNMKDLCEKLGMRFYVSDADFKDACHNGCCCGLPENWNYSRGQLTEAICIAKKNGVVHFSDIEKEVEDIFSHFEWRKANGLNTGSATNRAKSNGLKMSEYIRCSWNKPDESNSPYEIFRGSLEPLMDENGNIVYDENNDIVYRYIDRGNFFKKEPNNK